MSRNYVLSDAIPQEVRNNLRGGFFLRRLRLLITWTRCHISIGIINVAPSFGKNQPLKFFPSSKARWLTSKNFGGTHAANEFCHAAADMSK